ncbi:CoA-transferase, partial [Chloroflexota bacterium]
MKSKIYKDFSGAVSDIPDGTSIMMYTLVGPGGVPQHLIQALRNHGAKNLTIITSNFGQTAGTHSLTGFKTYIAPRLLLENGQVKKANISFLGGFAEFS